LQQQFEPRRCRTRYWWLKAVLLPARNYLEEVTYKTYFIKNAYSFIFLPGISVCLGVVYFTRNCQGFYSSFIGNVAKYSSRWLSNLTLRCKWILTYTLSFWLIASVWTLSPYTDFPMCILFTSWGAAHYAE
jgi:hypothetical protein